MARAPYEQVHCNAGYAEYFNLPNNRVGPFNRVGEINKRADPNEAV